MIPFMKLKWISLLGSLAGICITLFLTFETKNGFRKGIDFAGGVNLEVAINDVVTVDRLKEIFQKNSITGTIVKAGTEESEMAKIEIDGEFQSELEKRAAGIAADLDKAGYAVNAIDYLRYIVKKEIITGKENVEKVVFVGADHVGPTVGKYLTNSAIKLLLITLVLITLYTSFRFKVEFAMGAMLALLHDLLFTVGFIGVLQIPLSIPVVAALLTILGYSINDTIVIFDRIRENMKGNDSISVEALVDQSINESLARTTITSLATMISIVGVFFMAEDTLKDMALVLILGIIIGTYSSSFIASPIVVLWEKWKHRAV